MNLLEHYIKEIYDIKVVDMKDGSGGWSFVQVDMMVDCYGRQQRAQTSFSTIEEWEEIAKKGFYLA